MINIGLNDIIVDDTIIPLEEQNSMNEFFNNNNFPWYRDKAYTASEYLYEHFQTITSNIFEYEQFYHLFVDKGQLNSQLCETPLSILNLLNQKYSFPKKLYRMKTNFCTKVYNENQNAHQTPHIDCDINHLVVLYYVNDSDGDTFIFDQSLNQNKDSDNVKELTIAKRIAPKKGRCVIFNGNRLHAGMHPRLHNNRIVINYNLMYNE